MIRSIDWRDLPLLHRVRDRGLCLDSQLEFTRGPQALQQGLLDVIISRRRAATLVAHPEAEEEEPAVGRITYRPTDSYARLAFICPEEALTQAIGMRLLDALGQAAGEREAHRLIGEVDEGNPAFESLRKAGFAIYARQRIWRRDVSRVDGIEPVPQAWVPESSDDQSAIRDLYLDLVPGMVQQVEPPPGGARHGLVHRSQGELLGFLDIDRGPRGTWVHPYIHPAAQKVDGLLASFLAEKGSAYAGPLYFCVRSYQGSMNLVLQELGFEPMSDQAVMVKHLAVALRRPALAPLRSMEGTSPEPTAPFATSKEGWTTTKVR